MGTIYQIYGRDAHDMTLRLLEASDAIRLVPPGGSVALKPNLVIAGTPESGATTHPGVLSGAIEYFRGRGVADISVIEGSWVGDDTMRAMRTAGYDRVCREYGVPFFDLKKDATRPVDTAIGRIDICARALDAGLLVDLPVLKGHCQTIMTCALKNLKGCLPDREKRHFHAMGLTKPIAALGAALRPGLIIVDSICGDLNFEEGGTPVETDRMYLGTDAVQLDAYGASLMGLSLSQVEYIRLAEWYGGGKASFTQEDIVDLNAPSDVKTYPKPTGTVARLTKNVHQDRACSACFANLVRALYAGGYGQDILISIGQGFRGKSFEGLGIGRCCKGAARCVPGCPPTAEQIANALEDMAWEK
ncbi:MAG: DUF362 domain-containing protein [Clostridiales bacterium]|nr:DUF362 domain-containing protein [Clostridiales bacterium]